MPEAKTPPKIKQTTTKNSTEFAEWWATGTLQNAMPAECWE